MFYGKKIKELQERLDILEVRVKELTNLANHYCQNVDSLLELYNKKEAAAPAETLAPKPKPRRRPRKNNGKDSKATE